MSFMAWNSRQTWWDDVDIFTDYIARVQGILQDGTAKIPVAILKDAANSNLSASELMSNEQDLSLIHISCVHNHSSFQGKIKKGA